jgi:hypothetical protein
VSRPAHVALILDHSRASTATPERSASTIITLLEAIAGRPGSRLDVWDLGVSLATTTCVASVTVPSARGRGRRAQAAARTRWVTESRGTLIAAAAPLFVEKPRRASPLVSAIARVGLRLGETPSGVQKVIVLVSDGREFSPEIGDWECRPLPTENELLTLLAHRHLLDTGSLADTQVIFSWMTEEAPDRGCPLTFARVPSTQQRWRAALRHAGASVIFRQAGVLPSDLGGDQ